MNPERQGRNTTMGQWQTIVQGLKFFCLIGVLGMLVSCEASGGPEECAGFEKIVSCVQITSIAPEDSADVDALQNLCDPGPPPVFEDFTKHSAVVTFSNDLLPTADGGFNIQLTSYSIEYEVVDCPQRASACPDLESPGQQLHDVFIASGGSATTTVDLVPISAKDEYVAEGGELGLAVPTYRARYVFRGNTVPFTAGGVTLRGNVEFHITNFNTCQ
jgi:hypothetical protein